MKKLYHTNFAVAVNWCNNALILCNNIPQIDDSIWDNFESIVDLDYESEYDENGNEISPECPGCPECGTAMKQRGPDMVCPKCDYGEGEVEIYQWYVTDCSKWDMEYLRDTFGLLFTYSDLLDCYILCVTHFGTSWDYVDWHTTNSNAERKCGEKK